MPLGTKVVINVCGVNLPMLHVQKLSAASKFTVTLSEVSSTKLPDDLESEVDTLWRREQERRGKAIFNGRILSALDSTSQGIQCRVVEYRHLIAQRIRPVLYEVLRVRPVAVSGLFECADGVVFGKRGGTLTQDSGLWELVPSGGLGPDEVVLGGEIDYRSQIMTELYEEIGIDADAVSSVSPFCLVDDLDSHVLDIGIAMHSALSSDAVLRMHGATVSHEYEALQIVPLASVKEFAQDKSGQLVSVSAKLIEHFL